MDGGRTEREVPGIVSPSARFKDLRVCGRGATSCVYRAREVGSGRPLALKRLSRHLVRDGDALARFRREIQALQRVRQPGIAPIHDVIDWDGDPTLVMDFIAGEDLQARIHRTGGLPAAEVERIGRALFAILAAIHEAGIVHRDIKPQNVRLAEDGAVFLLDFGSARLDAASQLTTTGVTVGTPDYMPPELFVGPVYDPRVDIYGVGATLYHALTGRPPQIADSLAELAGLRCETDVAPVAEEADDVPAPLGQLVDRCLARDPAHRYPSASLALWALEHPDIEREWAALRSRHPVCLHCLEALPATSTTCPGCDSDRPFAYAPGDTHVDLVSVADPDGLTQHIVAQYPERAVPWELKRLLVRVERLGRRRQRYLSFLTRRDAEVVVRRLGRCGVTAECVAARDPLGHAARLVFTGALIWSLVAVYSAAVGYDLAPLVPPLVTAAGAATVVCLRLWGQLRRARRGMLGPGPRRLMSGGTVLAVAALGFLAVLLSAAFSVLFDSALVFWLGTLAAALVNIEHIRGRTRGVFIEPVEHPEPRGAARLKEARAGVLPRGLKLLPPQAIRRALWVPAIIALLGAEIVILSSVPSRAQRLPGFRGSPPSVPAPAELHDGLDASRNSEASRSRRQPDKGWGSPNLARAAVQPEEPIAWLWWLPGSARDRGGWTFLLLMLLPLAGLTAWLVRQHMTWEAGIGELRTEVNAARIDRAALRDIPDRGRVPEFPRPPPTVISPAGADLFYADAYRAVAHLDPLLGESSAALLRKTVRGLTKRERPDIAQASWQARCIVEADPDERARFAFLALEGALEAEAALAWWRAQRTEVEIACEPAMP